MVEDKVEELEEALETGENKMPRPCKRRRVRGRPNALFFKPSGKRIVELEETILDYSELEAIKLIDVKEVPQTEAAERMNVSQPTFSRILANARKKISDAIVKGKAIRIEKYDQINKNERR